MRPPRALLGTPNRWGAIDKADPEALIVQAQGRRPKSQSGGVGLAAGASDQSPKAKQAVEPAVASETNLRKPCSETNLEEQINPRRISRV